MSLTRFLFSDKGRCFNQSERALYGNFIIKLVKVPCARELPQKELHPDSRVWKEFCQFPLCFPIPPWGTLNKMAGAKLTNEGTVSPWAFKSEQHPSMLPGTIPCYWDLVWTGSGQELDLHAWDLKFPGEVWYWNVAACRYHNLVPRVCHLTALWGERGETLAHAGHVPLWQLKTSGRGPL